jgi:hypothetical protein
VMQEMEQEICEERAREMLRERACSYSPLRG